MYVHNKWLSSKVNWYNHSTLFVITYIGPRSKLFNLFTVHSDSGRLPIIRLQHIELIKYWSL